MRIPPLCVVPLVLALAGPSSGSPSSPGRVDTRSAREFGPLSVGVTGGFQYWTLSALETTLDERGEFLAADGFDIEQSDFRVTFAYGADLQVRLTDAWFLRSEFEWTRFQWQDRDRQFLSALGGRDRTPVSVSYRSTVRTNPVFGTLALGRAFELESVRIGVSAGAVLAPVKMEDELEVHLGDTTKTTVTSEGTGIGFEVGASVDQFTDVRTTIFLELFYRYGATDVELTEAYWESSLLPGVRRVDFSGGGIRLGFRFI